MDTNNINNKTQEQQEKQYVVMHYYDGYGSRRPEVVEHLFDEDNMDKNVVELLLQKYQSYTNCYYASEALYQECKFLCDAQDLRKKRR